MELNAGCPTAINIFHNEMISLFEIGVELSELGRTSTAVVSNKFWPCLLFCILRYFYEWNREGFVSKIMSMFYLYYLV